MAKVTMVLAGTQGRPAATVDERLELHVALTPQSRLDPMAWTADPEPWRAVRLGPDRPPHETELVRLEDRWALRGDPGEDAPLWDMLAEIVRPGEYVMLHGPAGEEQAFRIVAVEQD